MKCRQYYCVLFALLLTLFLLTAPRASASSPSPTITKISSVTLTQELAKKDAQDALLLQKINENNAEISSLKEGQSKPNSFTFLSSLLSAILGGALVAFVNLWINKRTLKMEYYKVKLPIILSAAKELMATSKEALVSANTYCNINPLKTEEKQETKKLYDVKLVAFHQSILDNEWLLSQEEIKDFDNFEGDIKKMINLCDQFMYDNSCDDQVGVNCFSTHREILSKYKNLRLLMRDYISLSEYEKNKK